jgi:tetratricopeptide (TPR) repeat protein
VRTVSALGAIFVGAIIGTVGKTRSTGTTSLKRVAALFVLALVGLFVCAASAQTLVSGSQIYEHSANSVVLIEVREASGRPTSLATAFVVAPSRLLTNAHAVEGGSVWVRIGAVSLPAEIERQDVFNDLALLKVTGELTLPALSFSTEAPKPGSRVFALGNPKGLEKTISEGLVAATRDMDGRSLLQMSAAVSPGSSGGPVLNERSEVVGVTVSLLKDAQNLNFAVPAAVVRAFLDGRSLATSAVTVDDLNTVVVRLGAEKYSADAQSTYQQLRIKADTLARRLLQSATSESDVWPVYDVVDRYSYALPIEAGRRAIDLSPKSRRAYFETASAIWTESLFEEDETRDAFLRDALKLAQQAVTLSKPGERRAALLLMGRIEADLPAERDGAIRTLKEVVGSASDGVAHSAALPLYDVLRELGRTTEAKQWFEFALRTGDVDAVWYSDYAAMLETRREYSLAGAAFVKAASADSGYGHYCDASRAYAGADDGMDKALAAARECLEHASQDPDGKGTAGYAHRLLSLLLLNRGVNDQALRHAQEAVTTTPEDGFAFLALARALQAAGRASEGETAAKTAIRLTDGAYANMHFALGAALFEQEKWNDAKAAFTRAANMNKADEAAAFNVALCFQRLGFTNDAATWYEEVLRRNPARSDAVQLRQRIQQLRR